MFVEKPADAIYAVGSAEKSSAKILIVNTRESEYITPLIHSLGKNYTKAEVSGSTEAFAALENSHFDVILSDAFISDIDTTDFFGKVKELSPNSVRVILTECGDREVALKNLGSVHQYVVAPCEYEKLAMLIDNSLGLRSLFSGSELHARIASIDILPSPPKIYNELMSKIQSDGSSLRDIADLISRDISISAKILQTANSAYFGLRARVNNILQAVNILGLDTIRSLVLAVGIFNQFKRPQISGYSLENIYDLSVKIGTQSKFIANSFGFDRGLSDDALTAGLFHGIGKLILITHFPDDFKKILRLSEEKSISLIQAERDILGVSDSEIGAHLLSLWGLPDSILEAVAFHYQPSKSPNAILNILTAVHLAFGFCQDETDVSKSGFPAALDLDYLEKLGLSNQLKYIRTLCSCC
jgi:HD-like signal output (HDOD) protein